MKLYFKFFLMHLKSRMAYKKSFFFSILGRFLTSFTTFLTIVFLFDRFHVVKGYTMGEVLLTSGVTLMSFALAEMFFRGFDSMQFIIKDASFDRLLLRPRSLIFQVMCQMIEFGRIGIIIQSAIMLAIGISLSGVTWTIQRVFVLILMIPTGSLLFSSLFLLHAAVCFFTLEGLEFVNILTYGAREYGSYPFDVYGNALLKICTYIIPYALTQYYPLQYLIGRTDSIWYGLVSLAAPLFFVPTYALWRLGVRKYKSAGS
ncbi:MAG: ABC-2 family transporter protein [Clostridia bacterium]|nr:ABC-2 family transporter protein [Clostridia bacterium]MBQ4620388.1 ABC-2 family transporter protein [Clostridia bacterium]MBQ9856837.1 ABC-2 family transporter protein [Clostridia bacterium]